MARPTTWRRSFNVAGFTDQLGTLDLVVVQPNETLGGVWWQYSLRSIGNVPSNPTPPLDNVVPVVGLILVDSASGTTTPVTSLDVGDVIDTQRRRRNKLVENRVTRAI